MQKPTLHVLSDEWDRGVRTTRPCRSAARLLFFSREPGACPALTEIRAHDGLIPPGNPPVIKPGNPWSRNKSKRWYQYVHFPSFRYRVERWRSTYRTTHYKVKLKEDSTFEG